MGPLLARTPSLLTCAGGRESEPHPVDAQFGVVLYTRNHTLAVNWCSELAVNESALLDGVLLSAVYIITCTAPGR